MQHFVGKNSDGINGPTPESPWPIPADPYVAKERKTRKRRRLEQPTTDTNENMHQDVAEILLSLSDSGHLSHSVTTSNSEPQSDGNQMDSADKESEEDSSKMLPEISCTKCGERFELLPANLKALIKTTFVAETQRSDEACFRYTGMPNVKILRDIFQWIEPTAKTIKLWDGKNKLNAGNRNRKRKALSLFEEYLLTLVRIRRGYDVHHLSFLFAVSQSHVCRIFTPWVNLLYKVLQPELIWPTRDLVEGNLPPAFEPYPKTRVIKDCTEFHIEKPFRPSAQRLTWSNYKHANTCKLLVGIMPTGTITFVSKLYSGSVSDLFIVKASNLMDKIENGDDIMADRGFNIRHLALAKHATLNIPAFTHGKQLSEKGVLRSRKIATLRIHVERAIRRMKTFRILCGIIPIKLRHNLNQIVTIVSVLCNLQERLV